MFKSIDTLRTYHYEIDYSYVLMAFVSVLIAQFIASFIWFRLANSFGLKTPFSETVRIWLLSRFGRYIPGKIPFLLMRINLYKKIPAKNVTLATITEYISTVAAAFFIVLLSLGDLPEDYGNIPFYWIILMITAFLILLKPSILGYLFNKILVFFRKVPIQVLPSYKTVIACVLAYTVPIALNGAGLFFVFNAMKSVDASYYPIITGLFYASSLIGLLAFFAPGGVGVREGLMMVVFSQFLDEPVVIIGAIGIRFITIFAEFLLLVLFSLFEYFHRDVSSRNTTII
ncbi:MAG: flippase-like domain-containing protein [Candidatus Sabulitectum sp.]|nr:flippase-like domain-containing protein [Candidatus Sabulitectum sp.]